MDEWLDHSELFDKTQEMIDLGMFDEAKALLDGYADSLSDDWEIHYLYSRLCAEQNRPEEAIGHLKTALRFDPTNPDCLLGLFYACAMLHRLDEAGEYLFQAEKHHPDHEPVVAALIWYHAERNDLETAIACFERQKENGPLSPETLRNAGIAYDRAGYFDLAADCFDAALEAHPQYDEVRELLSDLYISRGKTDLAIALYEKALKASPRNIRYLSRLVFCLSQDNQTEKALAVAEDSVKQYPNSPIGYIDLAYACLNANQLDRGLQIADKAIDIAPLDAESFRVKAIILSEKGLDAEAEKCFDSSLSLDPDNIETLRDYYNHFRSTGNFKKMEEVAFTAIEKGGSSSAEDYWFLADFYRTRKEYARSLHYLHQACILRPGETDLIPMIADILIARNHAALALHFIKHYVDRAGWDSVVEELSQYPELQKKRFREAMDFLMFTGEDAAAFQRHVFGRTAASLFKGALAAIIGGVALPVYLLLGMEGLLGLLSVSVVALGVSTLVRRHQRRKNYPDAAAFAPQ